MNIDKLIVIGVSVIFYATVLFFTLWFSHGVYKEAVKYIEQSNKKWYQLVIALTITVVSAISVTVFLENDNYKIAVYLVFVIPAILGVIKVWHSRK